LASFHPPHPPKAVFQTFSNMALSCIACPTHDATQTHMYTSNPGLCCSFWRGGRVF
jgi:hypothetical protein